MIQKYCTKLKKLKVITIENLKYLLHVFPLGCFSAALAPSATARDDNENKSYDKINHRSKNVSVNTFQFQSLHLRVAQFMVARK